MTLGRPGYVDHTQYDNQYALDLYYELVNRQNNIREANEIYRRLKFSQQDSDYARMNAARILESILWFRSVEFFSRFLADPVKRNNSKRCLKALIDIVQHEKAQRMFEAFLDDNVELLDYIRNQRLKFFAHADEVSWEEFANVFPDEFELLLDQVASILDEDRKSVV